MVVKLWTACVCSCWIDVVLVCFLVKNNKVRTIDFEFNSLRIFEINRVLFFLLSS